MDSHEELELVTNAMCTSLDVQLFRMEAAWFLFVYVNIICDRL